MGYFLAAMSAIGFGLVPLFCLSLYRGGMTVPSVLFWRFLGSAILFGLWLRIRGTAIRVPRGSLVRFACIGFLYMLSTVSFFVATLYIPSGPASLITFSYPLVILIVSWLFFREHFQPVVVGAVLIAVLGVYFIKGGIGSSALATLGISLALFTALAKALFFISIQKFNTGGVITQVRTFWLLVTGFVVSCGMVAYDGQLYIISTWSEVGWLALLCVVSTLMANITLFLAIPVVGPTVCSIMGVVDPLTVMVAGIIAFDEPFTTDGLLGVVFIVTATLLVICRNHLPKIFHS